MHSIVPESDHHVYLLIDPEYGVFYVGSGNTTRLRTTIAEAKYARSSSNAGRNKKAQWIREMWSQGREPELKVVFSGGSRDEVRQYESFLIRKYGVRLVNHQGIQSKYPGYEPKWEDEQELLDAFHSEGDLERAIQSTKEVVAMLENLRGKLDASTKLSELMRGALGASGWIEKNLDRPYLNGFLDDMARGFIVLASALPQSNRLPEDILARFHADGIKWLRLEDILMIMIRLTRAGYLERKKS